MISKNVDYSPLLVPISMALVSLLIFWVCATSAISTASHLKKSKFLIGTVIGLAESRKTPSSSATYAPRISYRSSKYGEREFISSSYNNPPRYKKGDKIPIAYNEETERVVVATLVGTYLMPIIFGSLSIAGIIAAACLYVAQTSLVYFCHQ